MTFAEAYRLLEKDVPGVYLIEAKIWNHRNGRPAKVQYKIWVEDLGEFYCGTTLDHAVCNVFYSRKNGNPKDDLAAVDAQMQGIESLLQKEKVTG